MKTMTGKRILIITLSVVLILGVTVSLVFAEDGLTPGIGEAAQNSGDSNFIKYRDNYCLDTEKISFFKNPMSTIFDGAANALFAMQKGLATVQVYIFQVALESSVLDLLEEFITPFIESMRTYLFEGFSLFFISICALLLLIKLAANRQAQAIAGLAQILIVVTLAFIFYNHPVEMMRVAGDVTEQVSNAVMEGPYNAVNGQGTGAEATLEGKVSVLVWNLMVHKPWQAAEFGSIEKANQYGGEILKLEPESDQRKELVEKLAKEQGLFSKSLTHQLERVFILLVLGLLNLLIFIFLTAFCVLIVGYLVLILVYMLLGVFVFLLALIPYFGVELVKRWAYRILAACGTKILLAFFLSLILVFMDAMYTFIDSKGILFTLFMIIVIITMIYIKRKDFLTLFTGFRSSNLSTAGANQLMNRALDKDLNLLHNMNTAYSMRKAGQNEKEDFGSYYGQTKGRGNANHAKEDLGGSSAGTVMERTSGSNVGMSSGAGMSKPEGMELSRYFSKAEEQLQKHYEKSKAESESEAAQKGKKPEYGDFVRRTNSVRKLGAGPFDQRDVSSLARVMQLVDKKGGNMDNIIAGSAAELHHEVRRPANLFDRGSISGETAPGAEPSGPVQQPIKLGIDYFKDTFGEEKGEEFFDAMSRKYDAFTVAGFGGSEKLTYAQVQRQLKEKEKVYQNHRKDVSNRQAIDMRANAVDRAGEAGDDHGKEER